MQFMLGPVFLNLHHVFVIAAKDFICLPKERFSFFCMRADEAKVNSSGLCVSEGLAYIQAATVK